jgi:site-specific recombinase XerD
VNETHITGFIADLLRKNRSPRTRDAYGRDLALFSRWLGPTPLADATKKQVRDFTLYLLTERSYRVVTTRRVIATLRTFYDYLRREEIREGNVARDVDLPKPEQRKPKVLRVPEVQSMLGNRRRNQHAFRDRAILELLYGSGLRRAELAGLTLDDVDFTSRTAILHGKGNKRRMVPLTQASIAAMQTYLHVRPASDDRAFFLSNRNGALGLRQVWKVVRDCAVASGVPRASTHAMRHSFATHFIEGGGDLSSLQRLLGHANIATTQIYIDQTLAHLKAQFAAASMRDKPEFAEAMRDAR